MKNTQIFLLVVLFAYLVLAQAIPSSRDVYRQFVRFESDYAKSYPTAAERQHRLRVFTDNLRIAEENTARNGGSAVFGVTKFMDLTPAEFKAMYLTGRPSSSSSSSANRTLDIKVQSIEALPSEKDWRDTKDVITPVKNQKSCGSCWAFSATEAIESAWVLAGKPQVVLAPQQMVDCDTVDNGCGGGNTNTAYEYIMKVGGQEQEQDYPYTAENGPCRFNKDEVAASISDWKYVSKSADTELTTMLTYVATVGPVSVCVDATPWQTYQGGVLKSCGMNVDHCVQVTGYSNQGSDNTPVWNVRNSWGENWGEQGYIWLERGQDLCSIAGDVTVPII